MIPRATCAALALVAGSLVTRPAAAQPIPEPASPSPSSITPQPPPPAMTPPPPAMTPPPWAPSPWGPPPWIALPQQVPYGYAPIPLIWRDGAWHTMTDTPEPPEVLTTRDPLLRGGITLASAGVLSTAIGIGLLVSAGTATKVCGLSGCLGLPNGQAQNNGVAVIAGGVGAAVFGGAVALVGARGSHGVRRSEGMMMTGMVFTVLGTSAAIAGLAHAGTAYPARVPRDGETYAVGYFGGPSQNRVVPIVLGLVSFSCLAIGIPLWAVGSRPRHRHRSAAVDASTLDLLPFAGGASLRWTR